MAKTGAFWDDVVPRVEAALCRRCGECPSMTTCPVQGFRRTPSDGVPVPNPELCLGCYACVDACPHRAIRQPTRG